MAVLLARVTKAIVQPVWSPLPKFNRIRLHAIATPMRREWNALATKSLGHLGHPCIQHASSINDLTLTRRPGAELAPHRTRMKVRLRFFAGSFFCLTANANLTIQFNPVKRQRGIGVRIQLLPLFALVIGKKHESIAVETFQQDDTHRRSSISSSSGQAHGIDISNPSLNRRGEPVAKLFDWIAVEIAAAQPSRRVFITRSGRISRRLH